MFAVRAGGLRYGARGGFTFFRIAGGGGGARGYDRTVTSRRRVKV